MNQPQTRDFHELTRDELQAAISKEQAAIERLEAEGELVSADYCRRGVAYLQRMLKRRFH